MKNYHFIVILLFSCITWPSTAIACKNEKKITCCNIEIQNNVCKMKCCQEKSDKKSDEKSTKSCDGKCGKNTCQVQTVSYAAVLPLFTEIDYKCFFILSSKKTFYTNETNISQGFFSIWSPPNIQ